jgi:hypothetical protein
MKLDVDATTSRLDLKIFVLALCSQWVRALLLLHVSLLLICAECDFHITPGTFECSVFGVRGGQYWGWEAPFALLVA